MAITYTPHFKGRPSRFKVDKKLMGKRSAGNPQAAFDAEGFGNTRETCAGSRPYLKREEAERSVSSTPYPIEDALRRPQSILSS